MLYNFCLIKKKLNLTEEANLQLYVWFGFVPA